MLSRLNFSAKQSNARHEGMVSGATNRGQNAWNQAQNKRTNHVLLEQFYEIFLMSCVVKMVER